MCGILVSGHIQWGTSEDSNAFQELCAALESANASRGPDAQNAQTLSFGKPPTTSVDTRPYLDVKFYASELRLRGESDIVQPHVQGRDIFCWNGEIFEGLDVAPEENDGTKLFEALRSLSGPEQIRDLLSRIEGPYAFVFHHGKSGRLYFARDPLGRRSLLLHKPTQASPYFLISSVGRGPEATSDHHFVEVSAEHIFLLDLELLAVTINDLDVWDEALTVMPRIPGTGDDFHHFACANRLNTTIPPHDIPLLQSLDQVPPGFSDIVNIFIQRLDKSVLLRVRDIPKGSLPGHQAKVAVLFSGGIDSTILAYLVHRHVPLTEPIDLLNVAFENPRKIRAQREENTGGRSRLHKKEKFQQSDGIARVSEKAPYMVPDRLTGLTELEELRRLCLGRVFNFVEVNVPYEECQTARQAVESLMAPGKTVMDLSLALALYFASRGKGQIRPHTNADPTPYTSPARVLLNGLGSDELLGGYGRHRTVFGSGGWEAVITELQQEIDRIPARNLGRDDRVISSHGKETRHPFLSIELVNFIAKLPIHFKVDPRLPPGFGDKLLLRLATRRLGLVEASERKKRAMQFGSHSARMGGERRGDAELGHVMD